ncbi:unnamed protein product [Triticum turgidum subsp. durum]|uniref:Uncharacterized protein n=1 Tax=Triticum turgidum subsp. durum TaxID=4567 RepID=A0A9R0Z897_TRITD|nr:unnamed protein product [Triticum turgidum subsp. durum]
MHPKQLTFTFRNLTNVGLFGIFPLSRERHSCAKITKGIAEKTNLVWEPSKDLKHLNLKVLQMSGFEKEDKVTNYIRLVMEPTVGLKRIELHGEEPCEKCDDIDDIDPMRSHVDEARRRRIKERLTHGPSSSVEIIIC